MAARNRKGLSENTRKRIQTTMIVKRLENHLLGEVEMTATQIRAAEILLNKTLPNLSAVEHSGEIETSKPQDMSDAEILSRITELRTGAVGGTVSEESSEEVTH